MTNQEISEKIDVLLYQYRECWNDARQYEKLTWEVPSITTIIVGVLTGTASQATMPMRIIAFVIAILLTYVMTVALYKDFFHRIYRYREIGQIEATLQQLAYPIIADVSMHPDHIKEKIDKGILKDMPKGRMYNMIATNWLMGYMWFLLAVLIMGLILTIVI